MADCPTACRMHMSTGFKVADRKIQKTESDKYFPKMGADPSLIISLNVEYRYAFKETKQQEYTKIHSAAQTRTQPVSVIKAVQFIFLSKQSLFIMRITPNT